MNETKIGTVTHYYNHLHVAGVAITDGERTMVTTKRLYWRRSVNGDFRIVAEDNG